MKTKKILETVFNNETLHTFAYKGEQVWVASEIAVALGYADPKTISKRIRDRWEEEFKAGVHYHSIKTFKELQFAVPVLGTAKSRHLTLLTEAGVNRALLLCRKSTAVELRDHLDSVVLPQFRRGMISEKSYEELKARKDAEIAELKDEVLSASRKLIRATEKIVERGDKLLERDEMILERDNMLFEKHQEIVDLHVERADSVPSLRRIAKCAGQALQAQKGTKKLRN